MINHKFGATSKSNLSECHPSLISLAYLFLRRSPYDLGIHCGARTLQKQRLLIEQGKSWTLDSKHLPSQPADYTTSRQVSHAFDYHIYVNGVIDWDIETYKELTRDYLLPSAEYLGISVAAGALWTHTPDGPHVELS